MAATPGITEYSLTGSAYPALIIQGSDGNLWFTEFGRNSIGRVTPTGSISEFVVPTPGSWPFGIAAGASNIWFTESFTDKLGSFTPGASISITETSVPMHPWGVVEASDGNVWFTVNLGNQIGVYDPVTKATTYYPLPTVNAAPQCIVNGPDGNRWFTEIDGNKIGKITPAGLITEYPLPTPDSRPYCIVAGPDGNLWFTENSNNNSIGRITTDGDITEFALPNAGSRPVGITVGSDGNLWVAETTGNRIARVTRFGVITEYPVPTGGSSPLGITAGPDNTIWFTENVGFKVGKLVIGSDLTVGLTHSGSFAQGSTTAQFTLVASNAGSDSSSGVVTLTASLPAGFSATGISGAGWSCTLATLTCTRNDSLVAGGSYPSVTLDVSVSASASGTLDTTASISGGGDTHLGNDSATDSVAVVPVFAMTAQASPAAGGSVSCSPNPVIQGDTSVCTATPNAGYSFGSFSGDCTGASCTLSEVGSAKNVTASFTPTTHGGGTVSNVPALEWYAMVLLGLMLSGVASWQVRRGTRQ